MEVCLAMLRGQLIAALTDEARQHLLSAMDGESAVARELGENLLTLDASILEIQTRETAQRAEPTAVSGSRFFTPLLG